MISKIDKLNCSLPGEAGRPNLSLRACGLGILHGDEDGSSNHSSPEI